MVICLNEEAGAGSWVLVKYLSNYLSSQIWICLKIFGRIFKKAGPAQKPKNISGLEMFANPKREVSEPCEKLLDMFNRGHKG